MYLSVKIVNIVSTFLKDFIRMIDSLIKGDE
jgi:hypothetical protein